MQVCEEWLKDEPDSSVARHTLAACSGADVPPRASDEYVQQIFDSFAASFEAKLARLEYRAPSLVAECSARPVVPPKARSTSSTSAAAPACAGRCWRRTRGRLVGVDLSGGMLKHAAEKQVYDELVQAELTEYLSVTTGVRRRSSPPTRSCTSARSRRVAAARRGAAAGRTVRLHRREEAEPELAQSYRIQPHGRYTHGAGYVERCSASADWSQHIGRAELRMEAGLPVAGLVVRAAKPAAARGEHHG